MKEEDKIELRSEEVQEILGHIPPWIIRSGISLIFIILFILLVGAYFFKSPDIIQSKITIVSQNPSVDIKTKISGKIDNIMVNDSAFISKGQPIAIIENTANYKHINKLKEQLTLFTSFFTDWNLSKITLFNKSYNLGAIQATYSSFYNQLLSYKSFENNKIELKKAENLSYQLVEKNKYKNYLNEQLEIIKQKLNLANKQFKRDSILYSKHVIAEKEFEQSKSIFLQAKLNLLNSKTTISNLLINIADIKQQKDQLKINYITQKDKLRAELKNKYQELISRLTDWRKQYILYSPINGRITFNQIWSNNQNVNAGDVVFSVIPTKEKQIIGRLELPIAGSGKVKQGQRVNIKLDNYPYLEYGMLIGKIAKISLVPNNEKYYVEVGLPKELITNYQNKIIFKHKMQGSADIITENHRLIMKFLNPIKHLLSQ